MNCVWLTELGSKFECGVYRGGWILNKHIGRSWLLNPSLNVCVLHKLNYLHIHNCQTIGHISIALSIQVFPPACHSCCICRFHPRLTRQKESRSLRNSYQLRAWEPRRVNRVRSEQAVRPPSKELSNCINLLIGISLCASFCYENLLARKQRKT